MDKPSRAGKFALELLIACALVLFTYRSPELFSGNWRIEGIDYRMLHRWRIEYAQESLRENHSVPSWYSREFLGSPFWSNLQNFPLIPTRLALLWMDSRDIYTVEAYLLALLSVIFTYLFARAIGLSSLASALAGFTFACSGFYVSRMGAGQIGILEVYPSLPLMLWIIHRLCVPQKQSAKTTQRYDPPAKWYISLAVACWCFALAAHPQIFIYSSVASGAYLVWRCRNRATFIRTVLTMALSLGAAGFMLYPMSRLVARSSRMLDLEPASNDLPFLFDRLPSMFFPWYNGSVPQVHAPPGVGPLPLKWTTYALFWDAVDYVGKLPVIAAFILIAAAIWRILRPPARDDDDSALFRAVSPDAKFITAMAIVALLLALPTLSLIFGKGAGAGGVMLLRSPARLMYLVTLALALALGAGAEVLLRIVRTGGENIAAAATLAVGVLAALHVGDLYFHDRCFINPQIKFVETPPDTLEGIRTLVGDGRVGIDKIITVDINRHFDDVGVFDSILLIGTYETVLDLMGLPPRTNQQEFDGGEMPSFALRACGVRFVMTNFTRTDETPFATLGDVKLYRIEDASPRVLFFSAATARYYTPAETREALQMRRENPAAHLLLPPQAKDALGPKADPGHATDSPLGAQYRRTKPDRFEIHSNSPVAGFVRILEGFDDGWRASVDGAAVPIFRAHNMAMAIPVPPGEHEVVVEYFTPGRNAGIAISLISISLLVLVFVAAKRATAASAGHPLAA